jgi:RNA polymerase sigma-70 factor, ECF subfamily
MVNGTMAPGAWAGLETLRGDVERSLSGRCRDANELDDIVQETFIKAARFRRSLKDPGRLRSWVLRIAWNVMRDRVRREKRFRIAEVGEEFLFQVEGREAPPGEISRGRVAVGRCFVEQSDLTDLLAEVLPGLNPEERELIEGYYGEKLGGAGSGESPGLSAEIIKMRLYRLRKRIRRELKRRSVLRQHAVVAAQEVVA